MAEARKLNPHSPDPLVMDPAPKEPAAALPVLPVTDPAPTELMPTEQPHTEQAPTDLPEPLTTGKSKNLAKKTGAPAPKTLDKASRAALILFILGFVAFVAGVALASAIVLGVLDLQTGWVKDVLTTVKAFVKSLNHK